MSWTPTQIHSIVMSYAHEGEALCPSCHVSLVPRQEQLPRYTRPITILGCPICCTEMRLVLPPVETPMAL
ncbi:MAG: hypothetical protein U0822_21495 [Anaerolineae bacterium]